MNRVIFCFFVILINGIVFGQPTDTKIEDTVIYLDDSIEVRADRVTLGISEIPISKEKFPSMLHKYGFSLIRKGTFFAQDIYSNGLKRGDIPVVIDGERYHSACPNRMDSPLTRINPLEMNIVAFEKENATLYSGLGGGVSFYRVEPNNITNLKTALSQASAAEKATDVAFVFNKSYYKLTGRYATGYGYKDGNGDDFVKSYSYKENSQYMLGEISIVGKTDRFLYRTAFTYTDNVMFPYLKMDERLNRVFNGSIQFNQHKLYLNYTDHMMDNELRISNMLMRTNVQNLTVGMTGNNYELIYRNWDSDNFIRPPMGAIIYNHLLPKVSMFAVTGLHDFMKLPVNVSLKGGVRYVSMGDEERLGMFQEPYDNASDNVWYYHFGLTGKYNYRVKNNLSLNIASEISSVEPELEQLYISVDKPGMNPTWIGNPTLKQPIKLSFRTNLAFQKLSINIFGNQIYDYVAITRTSINSQMYSTYKNIDALMFGFNAMYTNQYLKVSSGYTYAKNKTDKVPLSEIPPFYISTTVKSPKLNNFILSFTHSYNDAQTRIDSTLFESKTTSWQRIDFSIGYLHDRYQVSLEIDNILDETYHQHLSYLRDPFASGINVNEPGMTIRMNLFIDYNL